ncbi:hypothetical protein Tco_1122326 [Tanacetum coccineum]|uniref:DUF4218 domain-containing protein n=1 Tax=Tanacetum coccineum TaxID=301880 RepID=A0ABQ5J0P9_9ASTR
MIVTTHMNVTGAPVTNTFANHAERLKKFNVQNFKRWQQKMFFYLTTLILVRFLNKTAPQVGPPNEGQPSNVQTMTAKELWESLERKYKIEDADGFGSCFKHKVTDNNSNITGLKSHDCPIMMQRLLPYGLQQYFPDKIAKPIIELCSLFKQICSATLMEDDMLKAQIKVVDILCDLELIYPPALFDIMIHLVIHLPLEALEGGPIRPW